MHELAVGADHLLGGERYLLDWPAILVDGPHRSRLQVERGSQQPGRGVVWIIDGIHPESLGLKAGNNARQDQVVPDLSADLNALFGPGFYPIRRTGGDDLALVAALQPGGLHIGQLDARIHHRHIVSSQMAVCPAQ